MAGKLCPKKLSNTVVLLGKFLDSKGLLGYNRGKSRGAENISSREKVRKRSGERVCRRNS